jgi:hypothetical protein
MEAGFKRLLMANPREAEVWEAFQKEMHEPGYEGWLYGDQPEGWPADVGYWMANTGTPA